MDKIAELAVVIITSNAVLTFVQFLITRRDNKKSMGKLINSRIEVIENQNKELAENFDEYRAIQARVHILRFADDLHNGVYHSQEFFRQLEADIKTYKNYCDTHKGFSNGITVMATQFIEDEYKVRFLDKKGE